MSDDSDTQSDMSPFVHGRRDGEVSDSATVQALVAGDKSGKWNRWYATAIPRAEQLYEIYLKERAEEESGR